MTTLKQLETKHQYIFPILYKRLWKKDMLNWMRGFTLPLEKGKTWADDIYPTLKKNPPILLHSGGSDFELLSSEEILNFKFPENWDTKTHHFIPFAKTAEGNIYAFYNHAEQNKESHIVLIWEDDEAEYVSKNFEDFIFRKMLEATDDIDKDDLYADYGKDNPIELYRKDLQADLQSIRPYLKETYINILETAYAEEAVETLISYGFRGDKSVKNVIKELLDFEYLGKVFEHEI
ncbi:MAG: hypothetical protein DRQ78_05170 [Epsilonproteobacteria bacterium]|nr:MAG: hypothetical protein DRQ78_05170 [Campylobacterota bacterium]